MSVHAADIDIPFYCLLFVADRFFIVGYRLLVIIIFVGY